MVLRNKNAVTQLNLAVSLYQYKWESWIKSPYCFLTEKEIAVVDKFKPHHNSTEPLEMESAEIYRTYHNATKKLMYHHTIYREWLFQVINNKRKQVRGNAPMELLDTPLKLLKISTKLYLRICFMGNTLREVLQECNSRKTFLSYRGFGKKTLNELEELLKQNNCLYLLK